MVIISSLKDRTTIEGQDARFEIKLSKADLLGKMKWFKDNLEIDPTDQRYELRAQGQSYLLIIKDTELSDEADYYVKVEGTELTSTGHLTIEGEIFC